MIFCKNCTCVGLYKIDDLGFGVNSNFDRGPKPPNISDRGFRYCFLKTTFTT